MLSWKSLFVLGVALAVIPYASNAQDFSIDAASPEVGPGPPVITESDIFDSGVGPPSVLTPGTSLGLVAGEELDAMSYGSDMLILGGPQNWMYLEYSVDRATTGIGGAVFAEAAGNGAAGDQFGVVLDSSGRPIRGPNLREDATLHGLTPGPGPGQSDLDGHSHPVGTTTEIYYSINAASVATASARWGMPGITESDIFYVAAPPVAIPTVYATRAALGLVAGDEIDAVAIEDTGIRGALDPGDVVYISLAPFSPTLVANVWSAADVIQVYPGPAARAFEAQYLDLQTSDDLNALTGADPGPIIPAATNWGLVALTVLLLVLATTLMLRGRRLFRSRV